MEENTEEEENTDSEEEGEEDTHQDVKIAIPSPDDMTSIFVIGDPHFRDKNFQEGEELIEKCIETAQQLQPTAIIILGDILDTHNIAKNSPFLQAQRFIEGLSDITNVYCLIGNHDLKNNSQFLTDAHFFGPYKKWDNVTIVDTPISISIGNSIVVMCPFVPPGRFFEALDLTKDSDGEIFDWRLSSCIFAHQEIQGVVYNSIESENGDVWDESYPPLICGHIHTPCQIGKNVFYPGSSIQVASNEDPDKKVWCITFDSEEDVGSVEALQIDKIDLGLKGKKEIEMNILDVKKFDFSLTQKYYLGLKLKGTPEQFKTFRKSPLHTKLKKHNIKIKFDPVKDMKSLDLLGGRDLGGNLSFENILRTLVENKSEQIQAAYNEIYAQEKIIYELVFDSKKTSKKVSKN